MPDVENSKDLISVLWSERIFLRSKWMQMNIRIIYWNWFFLQIFVRFF